MPTMKRKFLRRDWNKMLRLGGRRKKLKWRRSKGRHAKIRQKWKGYSKMPSPGYKTPKATRGFVENKKPVMISNIQDLMKLTSNEIGIVSKTLGKKKKIELAKKAIELKSNLKNLNASKYLDEIRKAQEQRAQAKSGKPTEKKEEKKTEPKKEDAKKEEKTEHSQIQKPKENIKENKS